MNFEQINPVTVAFVLILPLVALGMKVITSSENSVTVTCNGELGFVLNQARQQDLTRR